MAKIQCKMCGGMNEVKEGATSWECPYCGMLTTFPKLETEQREQLRAARAAMDTLAEPMRTVAEYRFCSGMSYAEIAKLTGVRAETAAVMCSRARQKLRQIMREEYGYEI